MKKEYNLSKVKFFENVSDLVELHEDIAAEVFGKTFYRNNSGDICTRSKKRFEFYRDLALAFEATSVLGENIEKGLYSEDEAEDLKNEEYDVMLVSDELENIIYFAEGLDEYKELKKKYA